MPSYDVVVRITVIDAPDAESAVEYVQAGIDHMCMDGVPMSETNSTVEDYSVEHVIELGE